jgi:hypothetical protein
MAHARQSIRDNIVSTVSGLSTTGQRVFRNRVYPMGESKLPGLLVYTESEEIEPSTITPPRTQMRRMNVVIEAYVKAVSNYDETLDTISQQVEEALSADSTRNDLAKDTRILSFESEFSGEGDQPVAVGRMSIEVVYATLENAVSQSV